MTDPWADVRIAFPGGANTHLERIVLSLLADADTLLAVVREAEKVGEFFRYGPLVEALAALPEHLKGNDDG